MPQPQNMLLLLSSWHNNLTMMNWFWRHFWPTHANCHASIDKGTTCPIGQCVSIGTGWPKWLPKVNHTSSNARPLGATSLSCTKYKIISLIIFIILGRGSILLLKYIRSSLPAILEAVAAVLGSWCSAS
jgi:hypothetical protein